MTEGGGGKGGGRDGSYFADFSTAAVWCVPFCLDCSVPWVYAINFKRKKKTRCALAVPFCFPPSESAHFPDDSEMKVTLALLGLGSVAALQLGGSARSHAVQLGGARAPSRTSRVICGWGPDPVWTALEVGSIKDAAEGLKAITIKPADGAADAFTVAGQYVQIREIGAEKAGIFAIASSPTKAGDFEFLIKEQPESDWSPGTGWLTDSKAGLALEMSQVMGPGFKIDGVLDDVDSVLLFAVGSGISPIRSGMP